MAPRTSLWPLFSLCMAALAGIVSPLFAKTFDAGWFFHVAVKAALCVGHVIEMVESYLVLHGNYFGNGKC